MEIISYGGDKVPCYPPFAKTRTVYIHWDRFSGWRGKILCPVCHKLKRELEVQADGREICAACARQNGRPRKPRDQSKASYWRALFSSDLDELK